MKLMIVDDHPVVRKGLTFFFSQDKHFDVVSEATNGIEMIQSLEQGLNVDIILLDLSMPKMGGVEATRKVKLANPEQKILVLTSFEDAENVISAIQAGADGYCLKDTEPENLIVAIKRVLDGDKNIDPKIANHLFEHVSGESPEYKALKALTQREKEVLIEIAKGKNNREIAETLFISVRTVKTHITNLFSKLPVTDRTQAALFAIKHNLVNDEKSM
nr:response regulator transcription factor [Salipaludibacillus neizhouensis]